MRFVGVLVVVFLAWAGKMWVEQQDKMSQMQSQRVQLQQQRNEVRAQQVRYTLEKAKLTDVEYVEQKVRKDFGMTRQGDYVFDGREQ
jgi:cell division protein FtsB